MIRLSRQDRALSVVVYIILSIALVVVAYPLFFVVIASISDPTLVNTGQVWIIPRGITFEGYKRIFQNSDIILGYKNTVLYTTVGTTVNLAITLTAAYSLSRKDLPGRNLLMGIFAFTMFFTGGIIPLFLLVKTLGLYDSFWVMILPTALSVWNLIIARTFFQTTIPSELLDAAAIDGCSDYRFFWSIVLPLSGAIIAVMMIFYAVAQWNSYFNALIFLSSHSRFPLQLILREILLQNTFNDQSMVDTFGNDTNATQAAMMALSIKYGVIIVASIPMLILYPFVQRHYVRGIMIGAIKG